MAHKSWRDVARPIIEQVLKATEGQDEKTIKKALFDAYPFGERAMHPYKIWLSEVKRQRQGWKPYRPGQKPKDDDTDTLPLEL